ncbi:MULTISPECIES: preprotein translocase subunit SecY [unclassified Breznakia]|uniref:preprotein translocase subunit SecY n=1 Tax=unclassified Breznakia TaxID=2623764 RepID=UPI002476A4E7|nr:MULTISPECIES: preprotein translocase subunit SecY [unclassified Breznakia]MDH6366143.1 preprotein translocase subunit SecY [Breznakia sp. PH1-1]MDH6403236.1 preprotein translocase subunit SecY [Breznakia sp. PF1-11]MDH6410945.1 preprotein translocase subunit SecY [Breznakia sp. PFB1-11]MDH6413309.1 preprotein translocase subunit SecY [Breznakia sp. PFB1-14]MDH6416074.1 preprotein translocase subunit SecY [Breznakia sp. PFB1-4]
MFSTFAGFFKNKEIRKKILFTIAMLFVYRLGAQIPVPNVDTTQVFEANSMVQMMNLLGGGAMDKLSIFALGVGPYITASIIIQLLSMDVIPHLTELSKSGQTGKKKLDKYTRYLAVVLCFVQAYTTTLVLTTQDGTSILENSSTAGFLYVAIVFTAGTMFLLWLADRISMHGIGNGVSIIIFAGIVSDMPYQFINAFRTLTAGANGSSFFSGVLTFVGFVLVYLIIIVLVIFMQTAVRKIPIQYTSSTVQKSGKDMTYLPLKINSASVIPVIFASSIMIAPVTIVQLLVNNNIIKASGWTETMADLLGMQSTTSLVIYAILIVLFTFFYTKLQVDPEKIADNLSKNGTYIPGIRPGKETKNYINTVLSRITVLGAIGLLFIALLPNVAPLIMPSLPSSIRMGGTGLIIVVGVAMETVAQLKGQMTAKSYRGFMGVKR